jgi:hypothetical protein
MNDYKLVPGMNGNVKATPGMTAIPAGIKD